MPDINSAVASLKAGLGLPIADVKPQAGASSPSASAQRPTVTNPATQVAEAQRVMENIQNPQAPQQTDQERVLEAKDKAIADLKELYEQSQVAQQSQTDAIQKLVEQLSTQNTPQATTPPEPPLPGLPDNLNELPAEDQLRALTGAFDTLKNAMDEKLASRDEQLRKFLNPVGTQMKKMSDWQEQKEILEKYPQFPYGEQKKEMDALRAEFKGMMTAVEAAQQVSAKTGNLEWLAQPEPQAPFVESVRPSTEIASGQTPGVQNTQDDQYLGAINELNSVVSQAHAQGKSTLAKAGIDNILRLKLGRKT